MITDTNLLIQINEGDTIKVNQNQQSADEQASCTSELEVSGISVADSNFNSSKLEGHSEGYLECLPLLMERHDLHFNQFAGESLFPSFIKVQRLHNAQQTHIHNYTEHDILFLSVLLLACFLQIGNFSQKFLKQKKNNLQCS